MKRKEKVFSEGMTMDMNDFKKGRTAKILGVHCETLYYWIKKRWIKPRRDYRNYPVYSFM